MMGFHPIGSVTFTFTLLNPCFAGFAMAKFNRVNPPPSRGRNILENFKIFPSPGGRG